MSGTYFTPYSCPSCLEVNELDPELPTDKLEVRPVLCHAILPGLVSSHGAPDAIPQASLVNPAIEEDEIIDAQIVPEAPMSPAPHAHQGMYGHPPAQQNFLQQDYSQHRISISGTLSHMVNCRRRPRLKNELRQTRNFFESLS